MQPVLDAILRRLIILGRLTVCWPDGRFTTYAGPPDSGPEAGLSIRDRRTIRRLVLNPLLGFGEAYMDGALVPLDCGIYEVLDVAAVNLTANAKGHPVAHIRTLINTVKRRIDQYNPAPRAHAAMSRITMI